MKNKKKKCNYFSVWGRQTLLITAYICFLWPFYWLSYSYSVSPIIHLHFFAAFSRYFFSMFCSYFSRFITFLSLCLRVCFIFLFFFFKFILMELSESMCKWRFVFYFHEKWSCNSSRSFVDVSKAKGASFFLFLLLVETSLRNKNNCFAST